MIDDHLVRVLVPIMGHNWVAAAAMYMALANLSARLDVLKAAAKSRLPKELYSELEGKVIPAVRSRSRERVRIIHDWWGIDDAYPDALIYSEPLWQNMQQPNPMLVYKLKDFLDIERRHHVLIAYLDEFHNRVWAALPTPR